MTYEGTELDLGTDVGEVQDRETEGSPEGKFEASTSLTRSSEREAAAHLFLSLSASPGGTWQTTSKWF